MELLQINIVLKIPARVSVNDKKCSKWWFEIKCYHFVVMLFCLNLVSYRHEIVRIFPDFRIFSCAFPCTKVWETCSLGFFVVLQDLKKKFFFLIPGLNRFVKVNRFMLFCDGAVDYDVNKMVNPFFESFLSWRKVEVMFCLHSQVYNNVNMYVNTFSICCLITLLHREAQIGNFQRDQLANLEGAVHLLSRWVKAGGSKSYELPK